MKIEFWRIKSFFKNLFKIRRKDVKFLGHWDGRNWYSAYKFDENITERYLAYFQISKAKESLGAEPDQIKWIVSESIEALKSNNVALAMQNLTALNSYLQLEENNDWVFKLVNCFLMVDDEPLDEITEYHTKLKAESYTKSPRTKVFFCEVYKTLQTTSSDLTTDLNLVEYLSSRLVLISEQMYLSVMHKAGL